MAQARWLKLSSNSKQIFARNPCTVSFQARRAGSTNG